MGTNMFKVYYETITLTTSKRFQLIDITKNIEDIVKRSGIKNGVCVIFAPHATGAIIANENEVGLIEDIITFFKEITQPEREWKHNRIDDNAHAHIGSAITGSERIFPVINGEMVRGTWQNVFFVEMDGPRTLREVIVMILGTG